MNFSTPWKILIILLMTSHLCLMSGSCSFSLFLQVLTLLCFGFINIYFCYLLFSFLYLFVIFFFSLLLILIKNFKPELMLTYFCLMKDRGVFFRFELIVVCFLHLMLLICKVFTDHFSKQQFVLLLVASKWIKCYKYPNNI